MLVNANRWTGAKMRAILALGFGITFEWRGSLTGAQMAIESLGEVWGMADHYPALSLTVCRVWPVSSTRH